MTTFRCRLAGTTAWHGVTADTTWDAAIAFAAAHCDDWRNQLVEVQAQGSSLCQLIQTRVEPIPPAMPRHEASRDVPADVPLPIRRKPTTGGLFTHL